MNDTDFMREALTLAREAEACGDVPVGAVLVRDGRILCRARNEQESKKDPTAHAEMLALRRGAEILGTGNLSSCTLYVTLEPCPMCMGAILLSHPERVVFGAFHKEGGACGSACDLTPLAPNCRIEGGLLHEESTALLRDFFHRVRRRDELY